MRQSITHLLVIRSSAMGDVAMTVPVLLAFRKAYPAIKITLLTKAFCAPFFKQIPNLEVKFFETESIHKGVFGIRKLANEVKDIKVDAVVDLHNVLRTNILKKWLLFSGIPFVQIEKGRKEKKELTRWEDKIFKPLKSTHQRYVDTFKSLGFSFSITDNRYVLSKENLSKKTNLLLGYDAQKWIGMAPFAKHNGKVYSLEKLIKVIEELDKRNTYKIILFGGGKEEIKKLEELELAYANVLSVAGKLKLEEELSLISNLDLMLSMDSGNGHLAAMYGIPVITIWGVTHPFAGFGCYGQPSGSNILPDRSIYPKIPTSIYGNKFPDDYKNVTDSIPSQSIIRKILEILEKNN